jgi:hypothetical protein
MLEARYLSHQVEADLQRRMVFVAGPRQVGKTTMALALPGARHAYRNWDVPADREKILRRELPTGNLIIFDEIHKYRRWRNYLKGIYDDPGRTHRILVTGSARLDFYRFAGDSLQGRYHLLHMFPLSVAELGLSSSEDFASLLELSGFPEPFFGGSARQARRWSREYRNLLIREEIQSLERIDDLGQLELLMTRLPDLVGSPLSANALREDLQVSHRTVMRWLAVLERLYAIFRVPPFGNPRLRAVRKMPKHYQLDWSTIAAPGPRFENLIAVHLQKWVLWRQDTEGRDLELRYFRNRDGAEVDFVVIEGRKPVLMVEAKAGDAEVDRGLGHLKALFPACPAWQVHAAGTKDYKTPGGIRVAPATELLRTLS